jgi:mono/diheme cytochrome c family protein
MHVPWQEPGRPFPGSGEIRYRVIALLTVLWCTGLSCSGSVAATADGKALFEAKCAACHSVGGGPKLGPDLRGVAARRGKEETILAIVDPAKAGLGPSMPRLGLTQPEAEAISAYLDGNAAGASAAAGKEPPAQAATDAAAEATPEQVSLGQKLFDGSVRFANGGAACVACHNVNHETVTAGGNLAADLTRSFSRAGHEGLSAMLANAPFPVMRAAYEGKTITPEEIRALAGFLQRAEKESATQQAGNHGLRLFFGGAGGVVLLAGFFSLIGTRRKKRSVNQDIYDRQVRSE